MASHRFLHVGNKCRTFYADSISFSRFHDRHRVGQLRLVRLCLHCLASLCLRTTLPGGESAYTARVHGLAFWTIHTQHPCLVHHCHHHHLMAGTDALCRRHPYPSGLRYPDVDVCTHSASHLCLLYDDGRTESRSLYQCLSDDAAYRGLCCSRYHRTSPCWRY